MSGSFVPAFSAQSSTGTKTSFPNPQIGHVQSSGISSNAVSGSIPASGSPTAGYIYDPAVGDPDGGIAPGTAFEDIPDDWVCPICGLGKDVFVPVED